MWLISPSWEAYHAVLTDKMINNTEQHPFVQSTVTHCKLQGRKKWEKGSHMQIVTIYHYQHTLTQTWKHYEELSKTKKFTNAAWGRKRAWRKAQLHYFLCEKHLPDFLPMLVFCNVRTAPASAPPVPLSCSAIPRPSVAAGLALLSTANPTREIVPRYKKRCDATSCVTLYTAKALGGPCAHLIVLIHDPVCAVLYIGPLGKWEHYSYQ